MNGRRPAAAGKLCLLLSDRHGRGAPRRLSRDEVGGTLGHSDNRGLDVTRRDNRDHRGVGDAQAGDADDVELRVGDRVRSRAHGGGAAGMEDVEQCSRTNASFSLAE